MAVIYCVVGNYATMAEVVKRHREVTAEATTTRRSANCFNFLRQLQVLEKAGDSALANFTDAFNLCGKIFPGCQSVQLLMTSLTSRFFYS